MLKSTARGKWQNSRSMDRPEWELLLDGIRRIGLHLNDLQVERLLQYLDLLEKWNSVYNLTAVRNRYDMVVRHLIESLAIAPFLSGKSRLDVGTGPGLPGIPLAILEPWNEYVLLDSNRKKTRFLREVKSQLSLSNIEVVSVRVETWAISNKFDAILTRAFANLTITCERIEHLLSDSGHLFALKPVDITEDLSSLPTNMKIACNRLILMPEGQYAFRLMAVKFKKFESS